VIEALAAALLLVVLYCAARSVWVRRGDQAGDGHHRDLDVWHVLMGTAMLAMLLGWWPDGATVPILVLSALAVGWGLRSLQRTASAAAYARLAVGGAAMAVMAPLAHPTTGHVGVGEGMAAMSHGIWAPLTVALVILLASSASTAGPALARPGDLVRRLNAGCDVVMAAAMGVMLVQMI
jgi:hypothetical protein